MVSSTTFPARDQSPASHPFDAAAPAYDEAFSDTRLGRWYRQMVWNRMGEYFRAGDHVLDLGCGTGEDAVWLAGQGIRVTATDASDGMLKVARKKAIDRSLTDLITFSPLDLNALQQVPFPVPNAPETYDGAVANFGPVNCVADRTRMVSALASHVRARGTVVLVVMGPLCPWETIWHGIRLEFRTAFRRFRSGQVAAIGDGGSVQVWYPSLRRLESEFSPYFRTIDRAGLGLLLPPSGMSPLIDRAPKLFEMLEPVDRRYARRAPWLWFNDHYLLVLERRAI